MYIWLLPWLLARRLDMGRFLEKLKFKSGVGSESLVNRPKRQPASPQLNDDSATIVSSQAKANGNNDVSTATRRILIPRWPLPQAHE